MFIRSGVIYALANIASSAVPFLLLPLLTRVLSPAEYGSVVAFALMVTLCQTVAGLNVHAAMGVIWFQCPKAEVPAFTATALVVALVSTAVVALLVGFVLMFFPRFIGQISAPWGMLAAVTAGASVVVQCRLVLWQSQNRALSSAALQFCNSLLNVCLSLFAVLGLRLGGEGRNAAFAFSTLVMAGATLVLFAGARELRWAPSSSQRSTLLRFGSPLIVHSLAAVLIGTFDRWSVSIQLDSAALGVYGAGSQLGMVMLILADAFVKTFSPWIYARLQTDTLEDRRVAVGAIYASMPMFIILGIGVGIALQTAAALLLDSRYQYALKVIPWFIAGGMASGVYMCTAVLFFFRGRTARLAGVTLASALVGTPLTWWLVSHLGVNGAAIGFAATQTILALFVTVTAIYSFDDLPWRYPGAALSSWWRTCFALRPTYTPITPIKKIENNSQ